MIENLKNLELTQEDLNELSPEELVELKIRLEELEQEVEEMIENEDEE